jgi:hypothetical protein
MLIGAVMCFAWWCLSLWPCLSWLFVLIVGVLWVFYLQWHQLLSQVLLLYLPPPCLSSFLSAQYNGRCRKRNLVATTFLGESTTRIANTNFYMQATWSKIRPYSLLPNLTLMKTSRTNMKWKHENSTCDMERCQLCDHNLLSLPTPSFFCLWISGRDSC